MGGKSSRRSTGKTTWDDARAYTSALEASLSWDGRIEAPEPAPPSEPGQPRITVAEAITIFLANREATVAYPTFRKYKTFAKRVQTFADSRGYVMLDQFRPGDIDIFYTSSTLGPRSKGKGRASVPRS